jgi:enoyl-CoA hydratase
MPARAALGTYLYKFIKVQRVGAVEVITLNRPDVMNAWHMPMRNELLKALAAVKKSPRVGAVVLTGAGKQAFCAGQDLDEARKFDPARAKLWVEEWRILYEAVRRLDIPVVCALNGLAAGSAFQVVLLTDYRIGHDKITMGQPEINSGIVSALGFWILREIVGLSRAVELILTGRMISAIECERLGLLHRIVPQDEVLSSAIATAKSLAAKPPVAMRLNKQLMREATQAGFDKAFGVATERHHTSFSSREPQHKMDEFYEVRGKRPGPAKKKRKSK